MSQCIRQFFCVCWLCITANGLFPCSLDANAADAAIPLRENCFPEVWLCTAGVFDLGRPDARWDYVRNRLTGIQMYIDRIDKASLEDVQRLAGVVRNNGLKVSVECGGTLGFAPLDDRNGEVSAQIELRKLDKWRQAGGRIDYLNLDGPIRRLLYPRRGKRRIKGFESVESCANELMDYIHAVRTVYPKVQFFLLTNFPNWGYRGRPSYHARGPNRQDWGDYDEVIQTVLRVAGKRNIHIAGVTVDNPYEYLVGEHVSVKNPVPWKIDWMGRVRAYEDFIRQQGLDFNLIINSEKGGKASDREFYERTLKMLDATLRAGGKPTRYIVQSWYRHPTVIVPETAPFSMTALVKAVLQRLHVPEKRVGQ